MCISPPNLKGALPELQVDGVQYAQSNALLVYAGTFSELTPLNPLAALQVHEVLGGIQDAITSELVLWAEQDAEKRKAIGAELTAADGMICLDFCTCSTSFHPLDKHRRTEQVGDAL